MKFAESLDTKVILESLFEHMHAERHSRGQAGSEI